MTVDPFEQAIAEAELAARARQLLAAIVECAVHDCEAGSKDEALSAYRWIVEQHPNFVRYCDFLEISHEQVRRKIVERHSTKIAAIIAERTRRKAQKQWGGMPASAQERHEKKQGGGGYTATRFVIVE